ncbi:MAG TPA: transglutaminase family protein [Burkholderiaceae bacterium]
MSGDAFDKPAAGPLRWLPQRLVQSQDAPPQEQARAPEGFDSDDSAPESAPTDGDAHSDEPTPPPPVRWLRVRHETSYRYDAEVEGALHLAHLRPRDTATQQVRVWSLVVSPHPDPGVDLASGIRETIDPWGNARQVFAHSQVHDQLDVVSAFEAGVSAQSLPAPGSSRPWRELARDLRLHAGARMHDADAGAAAELSTFEAAEFALSSALAPRAKALADWARPPAEAHAGIVELALALMHRVHAEFEYLPQSTSVTTGALEALSLRHGVCQDFAHVLIGACRSLGLAARYVSGYLLTQPPPGQPRLVGADASHAWAAVWCPPHGWLALDPTNDVVVGQDHVTLAWGRDYADVAPLRGVIRGGSGNAPRVAVTVEPL